MVIDCFNRFFDCRKAVLNCHHDWQYLDDTTLTNFNSFATSSETIFAMHCNRQVKQTKSTTGMVHRWLGVLWWSVISNVVEIHNPEVFFNVVEF